MIYYHQYTLINENSRLSYSFSFSSLTLLSLLVVQLLISYGQWKGNLQSIITKKLKQIDEVQ